MKKLIFSAFNALGIKPTVVRTRSRKIVGVELKKMNPDWGFQRGIIERGIVEVVAHGEKVFFLVDNPKDVVQIEHAEGRFYEEEELEIIGKYFRGGTFVDIGSNVGNHAVYAAKFLGASKVIAIEPNQAAYKILRCNIFLNELQDIIHHVAVGLSDAPGRASAETNNMDNLGNTVLIPDPSTGGIELTTGDTILDAEEVNFIKIDVEGLELSVFSGLSKTISRCRPAVFVEVQNGGKDNFFSLVNSLSYKISEKYARYPEMTNYLITPV